MIYHNIIYHYINVLIHSMSLRTNLMPNKLWQNGVLLFYLSLIEVNGIARKFDKHDC